MVFPLTRSGESRKYVHFQSYRHQNTHADDQLLFTELGAGGTGGGTLADGKSGGTAALVTLSGDDHVVVLAKLHAELVPGIEVLANINRARKSSARRLLGVADRPVLLKGRGSLDGGLVGTGGLEDIIRSTIDGDGALLGGGAGWVVAAVALDDVVLDERVGGPAVEGNVAVSVGLVGTSVGDDPVENAALVAHLQKSAFSLSENCGPKERLYVLSTAGVPALATDKIATASGPGQGVRATGAVGVGGIASTVGPPRVVEAVVSASGAGSSTAAGEEVPELGLVVRGHGLGNGDGEGADDGRESKEERGGNHCDGDWNVVCD